jgi:hypothetical protein
MPNDVDQETTADLELGSVIEYSTKTKILCLNKILTHPSL